MAAGMIQKTGQDAGLQKYTPYKRPSLIQALFARISTDVDVGRIIESTHVHYKLRIPMKKKMNKREDAGTPEEI